MSIREPAWCPDCERSTGAACPRHPARVEKLWTGAELRAAYECGKEERFDESARICDDMAVATGVLGGVATSTARYLAKRIRARGKP